MRRWSDLRKLLRDRRAFAALEYTLICVVIGGVVLACIGGLGTVMKTDYALIGNLLSNDVTGL